MSQVERSILGQPKTTLLRMLGFINTKEKRKSEKIITTRKFCNFDLNFEIKRNVSFSLLSFGNKFYPIKQLLRNEENKSPPNTKRIVSINSHSLIAGRAVEHFWELVT